MRCLTSLIGTFSSLVGLIMTVAVYAIPLGILSGWAYWAWMAIKFSSFVMCLFGLVPPLSVMAAILGLWSLVFGAPGWLFRLV